MGWRCGVYCGQLHIGYDALQQVVEVMGYAGGELAHGFQFLGLAHLRLKALLLGDIGHRSQSAYALSGFITQDKDAVADIGIGTVLAAELVVITAGRIAAVEGLLENGQDAIAVGVVQSLGLPRDGGNDVFIGIAQGRCKGGVALDRIVGKVPVPQHIARCVEK